VNDSDSEILNLLREHQALTINELINKLGVTATAVRQKLDRLTSGGLIRRDRQFANDGRQPTRGRPSYRYELTDAGRRKLGNNLSDLAVVLWEEVRQIPDASVRAAVLSGVLRRLVQQYGDRIQGESLDGRLSSLSTLFAERQIPVSVGSRNGLPVLKVHGCPYPDVAQHDRTICDLETELFSRLVGRPIHLERCQDHGCCTFQAAPQAGVPAGAPT
jgi:predicted ArsR family transcriptional regulator